MTETYILIIVIAFLSLFFGFDFVSKGKRGERIVNNKLELKLDSDYKIFKDLTFRLKSGRTTQIDHIVVSKYSIFVIETKNMSGWIFGNDNQKKWTQVIYENKINFQNPLHQNFWHVKALSNILNINEKYIHSIVVFVGDSEFKTEMPNNVFDTAEFIDYIKSYRDSIFSEQEVLQITSVIEEESLKDPNINQEHINNLKNRHSINKTTCKKCGSSMVERINKNTNESFLGCSNYPSCRNTEKV